jgi:hypothetical protein
MNEVPYLHLVVEYTGEDQGVGREALARRIVQSISATPCFRVRKALWWGDDAAEGVPVANPTEEAIQRAIRYALEGPQRAALWHLGGIDHITDPQTGRRFFWRGVASEWVEMAGASPP